MEHSSKSPVLALHGGPKVRATPMPSRMMFGDAELSSIREVFAHYQKEGVDFGYQGIFEERYTQAFVKFQEWPGFADAVSTGTASIHVSLASLRLPPGSEVLVSPITGDPGPVSSVILNNLTPRIVDSRKNSYNAGLSEFETRATPKTKAILLVHAAGKAAPVDEIVEWANSLGILVVEDCSQAHGARINGRRVGTFGAVAGLSTMYRKNHATGGSGGIIYTTDEERYRLVRACADRGKPFWKEDFDPKNPTSYLFPALNYNSDEIACAIGLSTLSHLEERNKRRFVFIQQLAAALVKETRCCVPYELTEDDAPFFFPIEVAVDLLKCSKIEFAEAIRAEGIDLNPDYKYIVTEWPFARPYLSDDFAPHNAIDFRNRSFNLLFNERYGENEVRDIIHAIQKVERHFRR